MGKGTFHVFASFRRLFDNKVGQNYLGITKLGDAYYRVIRPWGMLKFLFFFSLCSGFVYSQCLNSASPVPLFWDANTEVNIDHYQVLRSGSPLGTPLLLHTTQQGPDPISSNDVNPLAVGYYTVRAVNALGLISAASNTLCVNTLQQPFAPLNFMVLIDDSSPLLISNLSRYTVAPGGLSDGEPVYSDRTYTYSSVPAAVSGSLYVISLNADKLSVGTSFFTFTINIAATVYVAHDDSILPKPDWLLSFSDTGEQLLIVGGAHSLFARSFTAGEVALGGNLHPSTPTLNRSMYTVMVR